jgi:ABC-2 type transport system permease protein
MEILKAAQEWARSEVFSTRFFIIFAILFLAAGIGFWQLGKTELAKSYIIPLLVAGVLLMTIGLGLFFTNKARITQFEKAYNQDTSEFIASEIERSEKTLKEYTVVFKVVPMIIVVAALLIIFINTPTWRAIGITTVAMMMVILLVDGTAHARIEAYYKQLQLVEKPNQTLETNF